MLGCTGTGTQEHRAITPVNAQTQIIRSGVKRFDNLPRTAKTFINFALKTIIQSLIFNTKKEKNKWNLAEYQLPRSHCLTYQTCIMHSQILSVNNKYYKIMPLKYSFRWPLTRTRRAAWWTAPRKLWVSKKCLIWSRNLVNLCDESWGLVFVCFFCSESLSL